MSRLTLGFVLASSLVAGIAHAESQAEIAARLNEEGKQLLFAEKYAEASAKFQDAHGRVPEPKYFFNHCTSLAAEGKFSEALTACNAADKNADAKLKEKIAKLVDRIHEEAKKQGKDLEPTGGGGGPGDVPPVTDPNNPNQTPTGPTGPSDQPAQPVVGQGIQLFQAQPPENKYTWTLGLDLYGGGGRIGQKGNFGTSSGGLRVKADYLLMPNARIGAQGYFQLTRFGEGQDQTGGNAFSLSVFDLGVAGYKHVCGARSRFCITPLVGLQLALMSPADQMDVETGEQVFNYASLGGRAELGLSYALGSRFEHVIGLAAGVNAYTRVFSQPSDPMQSAEAWGLDKGGAAIYFGLGYTYRFNTPFGSAPFVTLE
jgi:hypothetical protein